MSGSAASRTLALLALFADLCGCTGAALEQRAPPAIVGVWVVRAPEAPFPLHMFVFHADGTVEQSNPDAGDPHTSDSNLMGVWRADGAGIRGKLIEFAADRVTHQFVHRAEIRFTLRVAGDVFSGTAEARFYDAAGQPLGAHVAATLEGTRVLP